MLVWTVPIEMDEGGFEIYLTITHICIKLVAS
jgi:hypothetical protein